MNATDRRALWRPLAYHALAVLAVFASQLLSIWLLSPRLDDFSPTQPAGRERLYSYSIGELSVFAYSTLVLGQCFTDAAAVREDPVKSWLSVLPVVGLSRYMVPSAVSRWAARRLVAQAILLGGVAALGYLRLRRRVPSRRAWELVGLLPFWWAVTGLTAWLYVHLAITPNVQESVAEWLEPLLAIYIALHVLVVGIVLLRVLPRRPVRLRIPLPLLFADLVVV